MKNALINFALVIMHYKKGMYRIRRIDRTFINGEGGSIRK